MDYIKLLRPHQWIKNLFVLIPAFVAGILNIQLQPLLLALIAFCLASSSIYVINDIFDADKDKLHPIKKSRPIASGKISNMEAWAIATILIGISFLIALSASKTTLGIILTYLLLNLGYCVWIKHVPLLDCASIALGFCLRFLAGAAGFSIPAPPHLLLACYFTAFAMALIKRRIELSSTPQGENSTRPSLKNLNLATIDLLVSIFGGAGVMLFAQWTTISTKPLTVFTVPFLSVVLARIVWLAYMNKKGEDFSKTLISDLFTLISCIVFILALGLALYA